MKKHIGGFLLFLCFLLFPLGSTQGSYIVTEDQMEQWTLGLSELKLNNETLQTQLTEQEKALTQLKEQLKESQTATETAKVKSQQTEQSLSDLKLSWKEYESNAQRTEKRLERQRTFWLILAVGLAGSYIRF